MVDVVSTIKRSQMMAGIKNKDTKAELLIRKELFRRGFRYRLHSTKLPGKPDIVLTKYNAIIFIHGCFWHGHDCHLFKWPSSRKEFWREKILGNKKRDFYVLFNLHNLGWRTLIIWECALKGKRKISFQDIISSTVDWLYSDNMMLEIRGTYDR